MLSVFTLGNSADAFLLLRLTEAAGGPELIPILWSLLHVVKMAASLIGGSASDHFGRRRLIAIGWLTYAVVYAGFAFATTMWALVVWFLVYGIYYGAVEGALLSSVVFGLVWNAFGARPAFLAGAMLALIASGLLFVLGTGSGR